MSWRTINGKLVQTNAYGQVVDRSAAAKKAAATRKRRDAQCLKCYGSGHTSDCECGHLLSFHDRSYRNPDCFCQWGKPPYYDRNGNEPCTCEKARPVACPECNGTGLRGEWANPLQVGDILEGSWGYDQTNIEFYQVVEATSRMVTIRELAHFTAAGNGYADHVYPAKDQFVGEPIKRLVSRAGYVKVVDWGIWLSKWDGAGKYQTDSRMGH